jgi:hypothetical protein
MTKLEWLVNGEWVPHSHAPTYGRQDTARTPRLVAGIPAGDPTVFEALARRMQPPFFALYLLHTPRGEGEPGRYQSPELSMDDVLAFLTRYGALLTNDARHDFWLHSESENATIVWDRHNLLYAYGSLDEFEAVLRGLGFTRGAVEVPFPHEHQHHYRSEYDADARELLASTDWHRTPLRPGDEQF